MSKLSRAVLLWGSSSAVLQLAHCIRILILLLASGFTDGYMLLLFVLIYDSFTQSIGTLCHHGHIGGKMNENYCLLVLVQ